MTRGDTKIHGRQIKLRGHVGKVTRDACDAREGTSGQGDTVTRGIRSGGELASWHVGMGRCIGERAARVSCPYQRQIHGQLGSVAPTN